MKATKIRVWVKESKKMYYPTQFAIINNALSAWIQDPHGYDVLMIDGENAEFMHYTGLDTQYKTKIYEGDVLGKYIDDIENARKIKVEFRKGAFIGIENERVGDTGDLQQYVVAGFEVIGNIYQNPELLNK